MDGRRERRSGETGTGFPAESEESLLQRAVSALHGSFLHPKSRQEFQYSRASLVENQLFLSELKAFARAKEAAGYSREELQETFAFLLFDKEEEAREVCRTGLRVNSSSISTLGDPAKGVYISKHADCLHPSPWHHGKSGYIVICKLIKGKVRVIPEDYTTTYTCPSPGYDCHVAESREPGSAAPSPCQAFEQSQYYVYEVSGGSPAQRPRQVCPYIVLCCQYRDPKDVPMEEDLPERDHQGLYCPWRGELAIQGKLLCNITLRTPYSSSLPAQLPPRLDISHVMGLSDLRKKLPEAAFGKRNYTGNEVCFQGVYSSLYEVEISDEDQHKMDQLVENLKEKDLAIIKYLQDQGVLILLTPSDGPDSRQPLALLALFVFSSPRSLSPRAEKRAPRAIRKYGDKRDIPWKVASLLPGLRYALRKAGSCPWNDSVSASTRIKQHFQEYAKLGQDPEPEGGDHLSLPPAEEGSNPFQRFPEKSLCQLRHYLLNPKNYTLKLSAATGCLKGDGQSLLGAAAAPAPPAAPRRESPNSQGGAEPEGDPSDPWGEQGRRKSTRLLMSRKRGSAEAPAGDDGRSARRKSSAAPSPKRPGSTGNSKGSLLKLANLQLPHGRKRGAEVLSAKIVRKSPEKPAEKGNDAPDIPDSPDAPDPAAKRARTAESPDTPSPVPDPIPIPMEVPRAERAPTPVKNKEQESPERDPSQARGDDGRAGSELQESLPDLPAQVSPQSHGEQSQGNEFYPAELGNECDSHGLNLLADLALGSCVSLYIPQDTEGTPVSPSTEVVPVPPSAEVIPVPYSPSSDSSQDDEGISVSYSSGMVPVSHRTGVTPVSHRTEVTPVSHNCGVIPVSHRTEVFTVSHNSGVIPVSHRTEVFTVSHRTGVIPVSHSTGVILVSHSTEVIPASHSTGVIPVSHSSSSYSPPDTEVILVSQSPSSDSPQDSEVIPVSHSTEVIPASSNPSGDSPQDAEDAEVIPEAIPVSPSPPSASPQEQQGRPQLRSPRAAPAPDPKHQRPGRRTASTGRAAPNQALPAAGKPGSNAGKPGFNGSTAATAAPRERTSGIPSQSGVRPGWAGERQHCAVALEHSYAMVGPPELRRRGTNPPGTSPPGTNPPGTPTSGAAPAQNGTGRARAGPLVGKVLPFRRQPGGSRPPWVPEGARSRTGSARDKEDFAKCHTVRARGKSLKVTLQWDGHYAHNLDTRYTNNILERSVIRALHGPWDCSLPETVEDMKLILHTWVALFYRRPSAQLNSSRKVVEHRDPKKYVLLNSSNRFWDLSDDDLEPRGRKTCPADSRSDPDQTPSSSVDPGTPRKGSSRREKGRPHLRLRSYANGAAGGVDSTVSSSSGELPGEEEEPSSTSCPESVPEGVPSAEESLDEGEGQPGISEDVSSVTAEEPPDAAITPGPSEEPGRASERPAVPGMENSRSPAPNSSAAPCTDSQGGIPRDGEQQESEQEAGAGRGSPRDSESAGDAGHGTEVEDSRDSSRATGDPWDSMPLEASPGSASHPRRARDSVPLEASPRSANLAGASKEGLESQDPFGHLEKEEGELEEDKEENEEDFEEVLGSVDLVLSESSDTEMESEHSDQKTGSSPLPEDFGAPREDSVPSPSSLASPCSGSSTLMMPDGTWTGSWSGIDSPGLPGERAPSVDEPPEPWDAPATPCSETGGVGVASPAHVGSPRDSGEMIPPDPGLFHGAQPDSVTGSPEPAGETLGNDLEQKDRDHVTAEERWESSDVRSPRDSGATFPPDPGLFHEAQPVCGAAGEALGNDLEQKDRDHMPTEERWESSDVGSPRDSGETFPPDPGLFYGAQPDSVTGSSGAAGETLGDDLEQKDRDHVPATGNRDGLESPHSQGLALPLSPHSNSAYLMSPDGSIDPRAAPEDQETTAGFPSPSRRNLGRSSRFSREQGDDVGADPGEPNQERSEVLGEEEPGSPCSNGTGMPDDPMGAGGGQDFPLDYRAAGGDPGAGEGEDVCPGAENSPRSDRTDMEMGGDTPQEPEMPLHPPLESEPSSLEREGMSALEEPPGQRRSFPHSPSPSSPGYSAPASPAYQEDTEPPSSEQSPWEPALGQPWNSWEAGGAPEGSVGARSLEGSVNPRCSGGVIRYPAPRPAGRARGSPVDVLPREPRSRSPPPPHSLQDDLHGTEPGSVLDVYPGMVPPGTDSAPDDASWSCSPCASPGSQREEPIPPEDWEEGRSIPFSSAPSSPEGDLLDPWHEPRSAWEDSGSEEFPDPGDEESEAFPDPYRASRDMGPEAFPDPHRASAEVEEGEILTSPIPVLPFREHRDPSGERLEFSDAEDALDTFPRAQQLLSRDTRRAVAFQDPLDLSSSDSEQEYFGRNPRPPLPTRASRGARSVDAAGTRTNGNDSSVEGQGDDWGQGLPRDSRRSVITRHRRERPGNSQTPRRRRRRPGESHLLRNNLLGDWRGSEELTQNTLDMECLRFHYKLNQVLGNRKPPFSTSESIFPRDFSRRDPPAPPSAQGRSPLQVTIPPSHTWPGRSRSRRQRGWHDEDTPGDTRRRSPSRSRPPFRLGKLRQDGRPLDSPGDVTVVLDEYSELPRVVLSRADAGKEGGGHGEPRDAGPGPSRRGRPAAFQGMIGELCGALRSHLRRVASEASTHPGMFYLVETGKEPFFERVKALLRKEGWVRTEPRSFSGGRRRAGDQLLVIIRNEDISSHIHTIPGLLELKRCPGVVFAGVDNPEDVTGHTYQELFHTGGFLVSDHHVLESMSLARLKEVVKVLEKLNRSGRWKWLLHYWESKKLRGDLRVAPDAHGKQLLLKWCQEEGLVEVLPFHGCDSPGAPEKQLLRCLLGLQVQHVRARLGVFLTQNPGARREVLESKGILVADVGSFLGTLQGVAAPFQRSYW